MDGNVIGLGKLHMHILNNVHYRVCVFTSTIYIESTGFTQELKETAKLPFFQLISTKQLSIL